MTKNELLFSKENYYIMILGVVVIALGFIIMMLDKEMYGFGFLGLTLGPLVVLAGFGIQFWAIFYKKKKS
jgi:hypothetical protein